MDSSFDVSQINNFSLYISIIRTIWGSALNIDVEPNIVKS